MSLFNNKRKDYSIRPPRQQVNTTPFFVTDSANIDFTLNNLNLTADLTFTGVTAGTYGDATNIPILQIDQWGRVTGVTTIGIGGGGGTYTVNNGLSSQTVPSVNANNFQLGGATLGTGNLIRDTYITNDGYVLRIDQINPSTSALDLTHSGTGLNIGKGLTSQAGGIAVRASSSENWAFEGVSVLDYTAALLRNTSSTNDAVGLIKLVRDTSGTPFGGIGGSIDFWIETRQTIPAPFPTDPTVRLAGIWEVPGPAVLSRLSRFDMYGYSNGGTLLNASVRGDGAFYLYQYGVNTFAGTPTYALGVDASGNVVEFTPNIGNTYTVNNGLTPDSLNPNNFQLGGSLIQNTTIDLSGAYNFEVSGSSLITPLARSFSLFPTTLGHFLIGDVDNVLGYSTVLGFGQTYQVFAGPNTGIDFNFASLNYKFGQTTNNGDWNYIEVSALSGGSFSHWGLNPSLVLRRNFNINSQTGELTLDNYGQTPANFPGTAIWSLGVDASGNVVEFTPSTGTGTVTSVSATVPSPTSPALSVNVSNPTTTPAIAITANGTTSEYVRGDGSLQTFPSVVAPATVFFGDGFDGAITLNGTNTYSSIMSLAGSTYTLLRSIYPSSITVNNGITLLTNGYQVTCNGTMTVNGTVGSIGNAGGNAVTVFNNYSTAGAGGASLKPNANVTDQILVGPSTGGGNGYNGSVGWGGAGASISVTWYYYAALGGGGGRGWVNATTQGPASTVTVGVGGKFLPHPTFNTGLSNHIGWLTVNVVNFGGILVGSGGGGGGGAGTQLGGGWGGAGGGGGGGPLGVKILANALTVSATGIIRSNGGNGGNGCGGSLSNWAHGAGGGGGNGGIVYIVTNTLTYTPNNQIQAKGGIGGLGGVGVGTASGLVSTPGSNGADGYVHIMNTSTGLSTFYTGQY